MLLGWMLQNWRRGVEYVEPRGLSIDYPLDDYEALDFEIVEVDD